MRALFRALLALDRGQPLLIEGEPGTSKTTVATLAAMWLGWRVTRLNFSAGVREDMILGAFQPDPTGSGTWAWVDGPVTRAAREGHVLLLDEPNLAPPSVLDRLLPLLEQPPTLRLTERDGRTIPVSPHFRVIATQNPQTHAGRKPLSAALLDRFTEYRQPPPDESALQGAVRHWVEGCAAETIEPGEPDFDMPGAYRVEPLKREARLCPHLTGMHTVGDVLRGLARVVHTLGQGGLDVPLQPTHRSFGRRELAAVVKDLDAEVRAALGRGECDLRPGFARTVQCHLLHPFPPGSSRDAVRNVLIAAGLLPPGQLPIRPPSAEPEPPRRPRRGASAGAPLERSAGSLHAGGAANPELADVALDEEPPAVAARPEPGELVWSTGHRSGPRLALHAAMAAEVDPRRRAEAFERPEEPELPPGRLGVAIDMSHSIGAGRLAVVYHSVLALLEAAERRRVATSLVVFGQRDGPPAECLKALSEPLGSSLGRLQVALLREPRLGPESPVAEALDLLGQEHVRSASTPDRMLVITHGRPCRSTERYFTRPTAIQTVDDAGRPGETRTYRGWQRIWDPAYPRVVAGALARLQAGGAHVVAITLDDASAGVGFPSTIAIRDLDRLTLTLRGQLDALGAS